MAPRIWSLLFYIESVYGFYYEEKQLLEPWYIYLFTLLRLETATDWKEASILETKDFLEQK